MVRAFVLLLLGTVLAPVSHDHIPLCYYMVANVSRIKEINWNAFTLNFLKDNLATLKEGNQYNRWPCGNLALLQVYLSELHV